MANYGSYYGLLIEATRHTTINNVVATNNSPRTLGLWDDFHIDSTQYVRLRRRATAWWSWVCGLVLTTKHQADQQGINLPASRYGLYIADGQAGSVGDATINAAGTGYSVGDQLTCLGGTSSETCGFIVAAAPGGAISMLSINPAKMGVYTALPPNPVTLTGGTGSGAKVNIAWSNAYISGVVIRRATTAPTRLPAFIAGWDSGGGVLT